jgi:hypothetical protein
VNTPSTRDIANNDEIRIETANSVWVFEPARQRFWRVPRGLDINSPATARAWQPYHRLVLDADSGAFSVWLDPEGTRLLRSYRLDPVDQLDVTRELTLQPRD